MNISFKSKNFLRLYRQYKQSVRRCTIRINSARVTIKTFKDQRDREIARTDKAYENKDPILMRKYRNYHQAMFAVGAHKAQMEVRYCEAKRVEDGKKAKEYKARVINTEEYRNGWRPEF